jgi:hypothetical protein
MYSVCDDDGTTAAKSFPEVLAEQKLVSRPSSRKREIPAA